MARAAAAEKKTGEFVVVAQTFATGDRVYKPGERVRADDPVAIANPAWFRPEDTPDSEITSFFSDLPAPPDHRSPAAIRGGPQIPPHRRVESVVNVFIPMPWAKGSDGEARGVPSPFGGAIVKGQIFDALHPLVAQHPDWFEWPQRHVTLEDVERFARLEEVNDAPAAA